MENTGTIVTVVVAVFSALASSGIWAFISKRMDKKDHSRQMLIGLGHDRMMFLGMKYLERGYITQDEYENFYEYLYKPYEALGGNGAVQRIWRELEKIEIRQRIT